MRVPARLRTMLVCSMLEFAALLGLPMRPEQIEELMRTMNQPKVARTIPNEADHDDDGKPPPTTNPYRMPHA